MKLTVLAWGVIAIALLVWHAGAQVAGYEVIDLGTISSAPGEQSSAWAINDLHEVAGSVTDADGIRHAGLWLYCPNYGYSARQWYDLTAEAGETALGEAFDINMSGVIVGRQVVSTSYGVLRAFIWNVGLGPMEFIELGTFAGGPATAGIAAAVSDASPAIVVGQAESSEWCTGAHHHAFMYHYGDRPSSLTLLGANGLDSYSIASGINNAVVPQAAGRSTSELCTNHWCIADQSAVRWELDVPPTLSALPTSGAGLGARAWGINDAGNVVGQAAVVASPCARHAAFWSSPSSAPVDLGSIGTLGSTLSIAYRVNEVASTGAVTVVGADAELGLAYRWHRDGGGNWTSANLNTLISPLCGWNLVAAHDVSSDGWIVGDGWITSAVGNHEYHGFLLRPITCPGDLDGSCSVDGLDLVALFSAWSCTYPCHLCLADANHDGDFDSFDLGVLLAGWGAACECWSCPIASRAASPDQSGQAAELILLEGLQLLGSQSVADFNEQQSTRTEQERLQILDWLLIYLHARN